MNIVIVEDDYLQSEAISKEVQLHFRDSKISIIDSESKFIDSLPVLCDNPPNIILMDVMLRWANPSPDMKKPPEDIKTAGFYKAGFRCQRLLLEKKQTRQIPVIFYTVLDEGDLRPNLENNTGHFMYISKNKDYSPLINRIRRLSNNNFKR